MLFEIADAAINFYSGISRLVENAYLDIKCRAFEHRLLYYAVYDCATKRYTLVYDHDKPLSVFWYCMFGTWLSVPPVSYADLESILHSENLVVVCSYVMHGEVRYALYDHAAYRAQWTNNHNKVVFAYSNTSDDITHEFERFKNTVFSVCSRVGANHVFNMLLGYRGKQADQIQSISVMTDLDFKETKLV